MHLEIKKLITDEMLSDVLGRYVQSFQEIYGGDTIEIYAHPKGKIRGFAIKSNVSIYELKDKLEEWFIKRFKEYDLKFIDELWSIMVFDGVRYHITDGLSTKFEALLELYYIVKKIK